MEMVLVSGMDLDSIHIHMAGAITADYPAPKCMSRKQITLNFD